MKENNNFRLFSNCVPVKGAKRSIICDLQRNTYHLIPNGLYEILSDHNDLTIEQIKSLYNHNYDEIIEQYFGFLYEHEYIFDCKKSDFKLFPPLSMEWHEPHKITNCIIDSKENSNHDFQNIFSQLEEIMCPYLQLRFYYEVPFKDLVSIVSKLENSSVISVELIIKKSDLYSIENLKNLMSDFPRVNLIFLHSSEKFEVTEKDENQVGNIVNIPDKLESASDCGNIGRNYFSVNVKTFTESQNLNTCLNRKISIDVSGEIKNCPSMVKSYGNIANIKLEKVIEKKDFKEIWAISKDKIEVCKDCEFRHVCTDCRAFIEDNANIYSKPLKCPYNPYLAEGL